MSNARNSTSASKSPTHKQDTYERGPRYFEYTQGHIINAMDHIDIQQENVPCERNFLASQSSKSLRNKSEVDIFKQASLARKVYQSRPNDNP